MKVLWQEIKAPFFKNNKTLNRGIHMSIKIDFSLEKKEKDKKKDPLRMKGVHTN